MQRRQFFEVAAIVPVVAAACGTNKPTTPAPSSAVITLRKFVVPADVEPAMTFVPRRK